MNPGLSQLLGRTLVLVAHPDDEAVGCGALLQRMRNPVVLFCTDGAPHDAYFWRRYGSRQSYADLRRAEAQAALAHVGVTQVEFLKSPVDQALFVDQELFRCLTPAAAQITSVLAAVRPEAILTLAYEGGHPDHDACTVLGSTLGAEHDIPVWEFPLYHRSEGEDIIVQRFLSSDEGIEVRPTQDEIRRKREMVAKYASQGDVLANFAIDREVVRPMTSYDFTRPPHSGRTNYECWKWRMSAEEVTAAFREWLASKPKKSTSSMPA